MICVEQDESFQQVEWISLCSNDSSTGLDLKCFKETSLFPSFNDSIKTVRSLFS